MKRVFTGVSFLTLDNKNRLFIPKKLRPTENKYVLTPGVDNCVTIYPYSTWQDVVDKIETLSIKNKTYQRTFIRTFFAEAEIVEIDRQGRILIPQKFRIKYNLTNNVVLVGNKNKLELWSAKEWSKFYKQAEKILTRIKTQIDI